MQKNRIIILNRELKIHYYNINISADPSLAHQTISKHSIMVSLHFSQVDMHISLVLNNTHSIKSTCTDCSNSLLKKNLPPPINQGAW